MAPSSSGLGHLPFTQITRVRFPMASPEKKDKSDENKDYCIEGEADLHAERQEGSPG